MISNNAGSSGTVASLEHGRVQLSDAIAPIKKDLLNVVIGWMEVAADSDVPVSDSDFQSLINIGISDLGLGTQGLASKFGVSTGTISRWRQGKATPTPVSRRGVLAELIQYARKVAATQ